MIDLQQADREEGKIYDLIKEQKDGIALQDIAAKYPPKAATVPYVVGKLLAAGKVKTERREGTLFCLNNMTEFKQYLQQYNVDPVRLSVVARVRYFTIWHAQQGHPITREQAQQIKEAALRLTGVAYTGSFVLVQPPAHNQPSTFPATRPRKP